MFAEKILQNEFDQSNSKTSSLWAEDGVDSSLVCVPFSYWYTYIRMCFVQKLAIVCMDASGQRTISKPIYDCQGEE